MNRRTFLLAALALPAAAHAESQPWQAALLQGGFDGTSWRAGLRISMLPGWKTYWRVPGAGGIGPEINLNGENLKSSRVLYPLPHRLKAGEDDVIGYKDDVVFPLLLEPVDAAKPVSLKLKAFVGVCDQVCIPVNYEADAQFQPAGKMNDDGVLQQWIAAVPETSPGLVKSATVVMGADGKPILDLALASAVRDIFVEGKALHYFHPPVFNGLQARFKVSGAKSPDDLKGQPLRLTIAIENGGVEEMVSVV